MKRRVSRKTEVRSEVEAGVVTRFLDEISQSQACTPRKTSRQNLIQRLRENADWRERIGGYGLPELLREAADALSEKTSLRNK